jgi:hypothetical protein
MAARAAQASTPMKWHLGRLIIPLSIWLPLAIFILARIYGVAVITFASRYQVALPSPDHPGIYQFSSHPDSPGYLGLITNWDGQWWRGHGRHVRPG